MTATADEVGSLRLAFAVRAAVLAILSRLTGATRMRAFLICFHILTVLSVQDRQIALLRAACPVALKHTPDHLHAPKNCSTACNVMHRTLAQPMLFVSRGNVATQ